MKENSPKINRGHFLEEAVLGKVKNEYKHDFEGETQERHEDYDTETMFEIVKEYQPWEDPCRPEKSFPKDLLETIGGELGLPDDTRQLRFFTTVDSHLDWGKKNKQVGFDAFIECDLGGGECVRCQLDISENDRKITAEENVSDWGNKIVFHWPEDGIPRNSGKPWMAKVVAVARAAANRLKIKAAQIGNSVIPELNPYQLEESERMAEERKQNLIKTLKRGKEDHS